MAENSKTVGNIVVWHEPHCKKHAFRWKTKLLKFDCYFSFLGQKNNIKVYQNSHIWPPPVAIFLALWVWEGTGASQDLTIFEMTIIREKLQ